MDAGWIVWLLIHKFQALLLDGATIAKLRIQIERATCQLRSIQEFLDNTRYDEQMTRLLLLAVYSVESATAIFLTRTLLQRHKLSGSSQKCQNITSLTYLWSQFLFSFRIKKFMAQIEIIVGYDDNISRSSLQTGSRTTQQQQQQRRRGINSISRFDEDKAVVGFEDQVRELMVRLVPEQESSQAATEVIIVVGEGGSGKTTLARIVYGSVRIKKHFKNRVWVNVSNYLFRARDVVFDMLKQVDEMVAEAEEPILEEDIRSRLSELMRGERYLIVVDDVGAPEVWERLKDVFPISNNGSKIVITTRNVNVAALATSSTAQISRLNNEASWELFLKNVCMAEGNLNDNSFLSTFKEQILKLCGGLPLAIILMGGLLSMKESSHGDWARVMENVNSVGGDVLALSYLELPSHIKPCFLYMGLFPKASEVPVRRLLQLWIAERLVTPSHLGELATEDVADMYLEELINRNMIEVGRWRSDGIPKTCRLPGPLHDVFSQKAADIGLFHIHFKSHFISGYQPPFPIKRLASYAGVNNYPASDYYIRNLCSYVSFSTQKRGIPAVDIGMFLNKIIQSRDIALLTVLDLEGVYKPRLPKTLGKLLNLKYLGLRSTHSDSLPESVCDLPCLEVLDVKHTMISTLPGSIWMAKSLRHLYMDWIHFDDMPNQVSSDSHLLAKLHTLWGLSISQQSPMLDKLNKITSLRKLGLKFSLTSQEPINNWISQLTYLQTLRLRSVKESGERGTIKLSKMDSHQKLLDLYLLGVLPRPIDIKRLPPNLKVLTLSMTQLNKDPMQMLGQLPHLNILRLFADCYLGEKMSCRGGGFPRLHVLKVWELNELKEWTVEEGAMPCLRLLEIRACKRLQRVNGLREVTTLKELILTNMPSHFTTREDVFIKENKWKPCPLLA